MAKSNGYAYRLNAELARNALRKQAMLTTGSATLLSTIGGAGAGGLVGAGGAYLVAKHLLKKKLSTAGLIGAGLVGMGIGGAAGYGAGKLYGKFKNQKNRISQLSGERDSYKQRLLGTQALLEEEIAKNENPDDFSHLTHPDDLLDPTRIPQPEPNYDDVAEDDSQPTSHSNPRVQLRK